MKNENRGRERALSLLSLLSLLALSAFAVPVMPYGTYLVKGAFKGDYKVEYVGREIGNEFIVGYGLDYDEHGRTLPEVYVIDD